MTASVSTSNVLRWSLRRLVRTAAAVLALITLAASWVQGPDTDTDNRVGTQPDKLTAMAPSPDGRWLATGGYRGIVLIWDMARSRIETELEGGRPRVRPGLLARR